MTGRKKKICRGVLIGLLIAAVIAAAAAIWLRKGIVLCPVRALTGLSCPGCGNTRAVFALLHVRFAESLSYNYAYPAEFLYLFWVGGHTVKNRVRTGKFSYYPRYPVPEYVFLGLLLVWGVVRNILGV